MDDAQEDASASRAIHFGGDNSANGQVLGEDFCLADTVLSGGGVYDEEGCVWGGLIQFFEDAHDFGELVHEGLAGMESSSGIYEDGI